MVMVCIHSGMAAVGVMRPERTSEGNSRMKHATTDCCSVCAQAEIMSASPTMLAAKRNDAKRAKQATPQRNVKPPAADGKDHGALKDADNDWRHGLADEDFDGGEAASSHHVKGPSSRSRGDCKPCEEHHLNHRQA